MRVHKVYSKKFYIAITMGARDRESYEENLGMGDRAPPPRPGCSATPPPPPVMSLGMATCAALLSVLPLCVPGCVCVCRPGCCCVLLLLTGESLATDRRVSNISDGATYHFSVFDSLCLCAICYLCLYVYMTHRLGASLYWRGLQADLPGTHTGSLMLSYVLLLQHTQAQGFIIFFFLLLYILIN